MLADSVHVCLFLVVAAPRDVPGRFLGRSPYIAGYKSEAPIIEKASASMRGGHSRKHQRREYASAQLLTLDRGALPLAEIEELSWI
jgi:hypothetical protein